MPGFSIKGNDGPGLINPPKGDWLRSNRFRLKRFLDITLSGDNKAFLMLQDVTLPDKVVSELKIQTPGTSYSFAKSIEYTDLKMTFYGSMTVLEKLLIMADNVHNLEEGIKDYNKYKGEVELTMFGGWKQIDLLGTTIATRTFDQHEINYVFKNAWISQVTHGQLSYGSNDIKIIEVNIKTDFFEATSNRELVGNKKPGSLKEQQ